MNKIGFQNFRRFANFPEMEYGGITLLVGKNNSGKSTMVKALLLINDFLKSKDVSSFSFGNSVLEDANIVTFDRAKCKFSKGNFIKFSYETSDFHAEICISGLDGKTTAEVQTYILKDINKGFEIKLEPQNNHITFSTKKGKEKKVPFENDINIIIIQSQIDDLKNRLVMSDLSETSSEYIEDNTTIKNLEKKIKEIKKIRKKESSSLHLYSFSMDCDTKRSFFEIFNDFFESSILRYEDRYHAIQKGKKSDKEFENLRGFKEDFFVINKRFLDFINSIDKQSQNYLGANPAKQSALFAIRDKNNALAQAINEFKQLGIEKETGNDAYRFVDNWMKSFEIGEGLNIELHAGEAYEVRILSEKSWIPLADKGMGSIQAMLLIIRLACIIFKSKKYEKQHTVIIEEPELNLHPALQSKLADLFHEVYIKYGIQLIIETHSEYLIRKTQLIVKENEYEVKPNENPFTVVYFDSNEDKQWKMEYREDGKFANEFGTGFYDESAMLTLNLL